MVHQEDLNATDAFVGGLTTIRKNIIIVSSLIAIALFLQVLSSGLTMVLGSGKHNYLLQILLSTGTSLLINLLLVKCYFSLIAEETEIRDNTFYLLKQVKFTLFSVLVWIPFFAIVAFVTVFLYNDVFTVSTFSMLAMIFYLFVVLLFFDFLMIVMYVVEMEYVVTDKTIKETIKFMQDVLGDNKKDFFKKLFGVLGIQFTTNLILTMFLFLIILFVESNMAIYIDYMDMSLQGGTTLMYIAVSAVVILFGYIVLVVQYVCIVSVFAIYFNYCDKANIGLAGVRDRKNLKVETKGNGNNI